MTDAALLELAEADRRLIVTLDKDFWQLALQRPAPLEYSGVILFKVFPSTAENLMLLVTQVLNWEHEWAGHVSVVTRQGVEIILLAGDNESLTAKIRRAL
jgi:predicted nuclease of predicted toxin-antitoxin system